MNKKYYHGKNREVARASRKNYYRRHRKECLAKAREYTARDPERWKKYKSDYVKRTRREACAAVDLLKNVPCADCGRCYPPWVMDFDHGYNAKVDNVSHLARKPNGLKRALEEARKCEIVCSNCHRERTHERMLWAMAAAEVEQLPVFL
jgi:hypothetical protein